MYRKIFNLSDDIIAQVDCSSIYDIIIRYYNKDIWFYEVYIDSYPLIYTDARLFDLAYIHLPTVHIKRKKIIEDLL